MTTNKEKREIEVALVDEVVAILKSGSTLIEEDYEKIDNALISARGIRRRQSKKSRFQKFIMNNPDMNQCDCEEIIAEIAEEWN